VIKFYSLKARHALHALHSLTLRPCLSHSSDPHQANQSQFIALWKLVSCVIHRTPIIFVQLVQDYAHLQPIQTLGLHIEKLEC